MGRICEIASRRDSRALEEFWSRILGYHQLWILKAHLDERIEEEQIRGAEAGSETRRGLEPLPALNYERDIIVGSHLLDNVTTLWGSPFISSVAPFFPKSDRFVLHLKPRMEGRWKLRLLNIDSKQVLLFWNKRHKQPENGFCNLQEEILKFSLVF